MSAYELYENDNRSRTTDDIVEDTHQFFKVIRQHNHEQKIHEENLHQKIVDAAAAKEETYKSLNTMGFIKKKEHPAIRRQKMAHRNTWKKAVKEWIDFRKLTEPDFEEWHVRQGLPRLKRVEIFTRAMTEKNLSFEEALRFCGYPQLSNKEKEMIRAKVPVHRREEIKRGENMPVAPQNTPAPEDESIDSDDTDMPSLIPASQSFTAYPTCRYCGQQGLHWSLACPQANVSPESYYARQNHVESKPTLDQAKQRFDQAVKQQREANEEVNQAKAALARVIYDEQVKLNALKKAIFGEEDDC